MSDPAAPGAGELQPTATAAARIEVLPLVGIGEVAPGDDLAALIAKLGADLRDDDILVVTSKIVSKAEGRLVPAPSDPAGREAARQDAVTAESVRVVAARGRTRIVQTRHGLVLAAAGVDASNVDTSQLVLLPVDPDASARVLRAELRARLGIRVAVVVTDTMGRTWRNGQTDVAIGTAGLAPLRDHRGQTDPYGNDLSVTAAAVIDELAAAADLVKGKTSGVPVAVVRGLGPVAADDGPGAAALVRPSAEDMFSLGTAEALAAGRRAAVAALLADGRFTTDPVPDEAVRAVTATLAGTVDDPDGWRYVHVASTPARRALTAATASAGTAADGTAMAAGGVAADPTDGATAGAITTAPAILVAFRADGAASETFARALVSAAAGAGLAARVVPAPRDVAEALSVPPEWVPVGIGLLGFPAAHLADDRDPGDTYLTR
jgi:coenzyme F420-0:L-glutamate ligase/coenzyme F420-1:gamma-L-glutamate ligase